MGKPQFSVGAGSLLLAVLLSTACSADKTSQIHHIGDYFIRVTTEPQELRVGRDAEVTAHISRDDQDMEICRVSFRQYMPKQQMTTDHMMHVMKHIGRGTYRAHGSEFSMGGDWTIEFQFNCGDGMKTIVFPYNLQWM